MPKGKKHYQIKLADAIEAHDKALLRGGHPGIINLSLVQSTIERPYNGYCRQIWKKAAGLFESLCRNHGFTDGNKRTAVTPLILLLERSGYDLLPLPDEDIFDAIEEFAVSVANGEMVINEIEAWLRARII